MRTRAWRRYKNYTKAKRKREIDLQSHWWPYPYDNYLTFWVNGHRCGWYDNLHQYSKNKIHCSCPMCSTKTRNKGKRKKSQYYAPVINYRMMDLRRKMAMDMNQQDYLVELENQE